MIFDIEQHHFAIWANNSLYAGGFEEKEKDGMIELHGYVMKKSMDKTIWKNSLGKFSYPMDALLTKKEIIVVGSQGMGKDKGLLKILDRKEGNSIMEMKVSLGEYPSGDICFDYIRKLPEGFLVVGEVYLDKENIDSIFMVLNKNYEVTACKIIPDTNVTDVKIKRGKKPVEMMMVKYDKGTVRDFLCITDVELNGVHSVDVDACIEVQAS